MFAAVAIVSAVLAALLVFAAARKLTHADAVVAEYARLGVTEDKLNPLAACLLAGAAGLVAGLFWTPIGIAAAIGVLCYFAGAIVVHLRAGDAAHLPVPGAVTLLAVAALVLHLVS